MTAGAGGTNWRYVPLAEEHLAAVTEIEQLCFPTPWSRQLFLDELQKKDICFWKAALLPGGRVIGYMGYWRIIDEAHITNLAVHPQFRRTGLGRGLVAEILKDAAARGCDKATLEVRPSNQAAVSLYESFGFSPVALRPRYYSDDQEDALLMWKIDLKKMR
jgi:[ribosomal protein S18]-alanine N-acetyltransferase